MSTYFFSLCRKLFLTNESKHVLVSLFVSLCGGRGEEKEKERDKERERERNRDR
jgi:hypothetical protein